MNILRAMLKSSGSILIIISIAILFFPELLSSIQDIGRLQVLVENSPALSIGAIGLMMVYSLWIVVAGGKDSSSSDEMTKFGSDMVEIPENREKELSGWHFDQKIHRLDQGRDHDVREFRESMKDLVLDHLEKAEGLGENIARQSVKKGTWTSDRTAAAFVSDDLNYPIHERFFSWLENSPRVEKRSRKVLETLEARDQ